MFMSNIYAVVSYNEFDCCNQAAKVRINGLYLNIEDAHVRQEKICGGITTPSLLNSKCVNGVNGIITWIKEIPIGDLDRFDIYVP